MLEKGNALLLLVDPLPTKGWATNKGVWHSYTVATVIAMMLFVLSSYNCGPFTTGSLCTSHCPSSLHTPHCLISIPSAGSGLTPYISLWVI